MWYHWKGPKPYPQVVEFMNKTYPPDWTYADFAAQFRAEFYGKYKSFSSYSQAKSHFILDPNEWADILAASGAKCVYFIFIVVEITLFYFCLDMWFLLLRFASFLKYNLIVQFDLFLLNSIMKVLQCGHQSIHSIGMPWMLVQNEI